MKLTTITKDKQILLQLLWKRGPLSVAEAAKLATTYRHRVSQLLKEMGEEGLVIQKERGHSRGGRRPALFGLNPGIGTAIGIDIGLTRIRGVAVDATGKMFREAKRPTPLGSQFPERIFTAIGRLVREELSSKGPLLGIGVAMAGLLHPQSGAVIFSPKFGQWRNLPLGERLRKEFNIPVYLQGNARAMARGEKHFGAGKGIDNLACLNLATGIGLGLLIEGRVYEGSCHYAGELGHIVVEPASGGPRCNCGNYGCLEVMASGLAIARQAKEALREGVTSLISELAPEGKITAQTVCQAAARGDKLAFSIIERTSNYLAMGIANVINLFNPEMVVLAGGVARSKEVIWNPIRRQLKLHALQIPLDKTRIIFSEVGDNLGALGASTVVLERLFEGDNE